MGQARRRKQSDPNYGTKMVRKGFVTQSAYAEDIAKQLKEHDANCTDPNCQKKDLVFQYEGFKQIMLTLPGHPKEVFLMLENNALPHLAFQLETGDEVVGLVGPDDENVRRQLPNPIYTTVSCHDKGVAYAIDRDNPGYVYIICAEKSCQHILSNKDFKARFKLASYPKAEYPNIFCRDHGIQPAYLFCEHLYEGAPTDFIELHTAEEPGTALCSVCSKFWKKGQFGKLKGITHMGCLDDVNAMAGGKIKALLSEPPPQDFISVNLLGTKS